MTDYKPPTDQIIQHVNNVRKYLPFDDERDFEDAGRGLIARLVPNKVENDEGDTIWDNEGYAFLEGESPNTANPSLWRQSRLCSMDGLFQVVDGIYQVRGIDLSNTTFVEGENGIIVIDALACVETAQAALRLYREHRPPKPIMGIIITHSHVDHFGGVKAFASEDQVASGEVRMFVPQGFLENAVSENVYAGTCMTRRAAYMYGTGVSPGPQSQIGAGLGQTVSTGSISLIAPNERDIIVKTGQTATVDTVNMVFQMAPDTEAPSEMLIYFPDFKALCAAEDATHTFHNLLTLRGAVVRDAASWSKYLTETIETFGNDAEVVFASHHWPVWNGKENEKRVVEFLTSQRDTYAYVHDQTLRLLNLGLTGPEIAEQMVLPPALEKTWSSRGYYGSVNHNIKAIYQRYIGWFDGNPAHLWEHTPVDKAKRYVEAVGGIDQVLKKGQEAFNNGDFRWAAELVNHAVFAEPDRKDAKQLLADTYEQLGYGAENGTWRNFYVSGAWELRNYNFGTPTQNLSVDVLSQLTPDMTFDCLAIQIKGPEAWDKNISVIVNTLDVGERYLLYLSHGVLIHTTATTSTQADVYIDLKSKNLYQLVLCGLDPQKLSSVGIIVHGNTDALSTLSRLLEPGNPSFNIVTP